MLLLHTTDALNRAAALHNIRVLCPVIAAYAINTYRQPARLFITGGKEIASAEGTTQGDPLAMGLYALSIQPLITSLQVASSVRQCWFADDASGAGSVTEIKKWCDVLSTLGPDFGYFRSDKKCWIIAKPAKEENFKDVFKETSINVIVQGQKHLGAVLSSQEYLEEYVSEKVSNWVRIIPTTSEVRSLHLWLETSVDVFLKNSPRHSGSARASRECNISGAHSCYY